MQTPPPINKPKKNKTLAIVLIIIAVLIALCVIIFLLSNSWSKTPEGIAALTQGAIDKTSTAASVTLEPSATPKPENTLDPIKTIKPTKTANSTRTPTPTKEASGISYRDIINFKDGATEIQWKDYKSQINGQRVVWQGTVGEVTKSLGSYSIYLCTDSYCLYTFHFNTENEDFAMGLMKGDPLTVDGEIDTDLVDFLNVIGLDIYLNNAIVVSP